MKQYFYITIHFSPEYEGTVFTKYQDNLYRNTETGEIYRKRLLYDFGWGQESGFELLPQLSFDDLIKLIECPTELPQKWFWQKCNKEQIQQVNIWRNNLYGAVAVVMQDYVEELISFLSAKVDTDYFSNPSIRENFKCFLLIPKKQEQKVKFRVESLHNHTKTFLRIILNGKELLQRLLVRSTDEHRENSLYKSQI